MDLSRQARQSPGGKSSHIVEERCARLHAQVRYHRVEAQVHAPVELPSLSGGRAAAPARPRSRSESPPAREPEIRGPGPRSLSQSQPESAEAKAVCLRACVSPGGPRVGTLSFLTGSSRPPNGRAPSFHKNGAPSVSAGRHLDWPVDAPRSPHA